MIRTSDRYIFSQVAKATVFAVASLSMFIVMGQIFQKIRPLIVDYHAPLPLIGKFIINVFPLSLMYTIPWGFMAAVLLVFGRLSREQEINALQLGGQSLPRIAAPVFLLGALLAGICLWINLTIIPKANEIVGNIKYEIVAYDPKGMITPGTISNMEKLKIFVQKKSNDRVYSLHLYKLPNLKKHETRCEYVYAEDALLAVEPATQKINLSLNTANIERNDGKGGIDVIIASAWPWKIDLTQKKEWKAKSMTNQQIHAFLANPPASFKAAKAAEYLAVITQRYSFAMASLAFAFIAVPLSLGRRRKDSNSGILTALLLGAAYFIFSLLAQKSSDPMTANLLLWSPNLACVLGGLILFRRVRFH